MSANGEEEEDKLETAFEASPLTIPANAEIAFSFNELESNDNAALEMNVTLSECLHQSESAFAFPSPRNEIEPPTYSPEVQTRSIDGDDDFDDADDAEVDFSELLEEIHVFEVTTQGNVYTLVKVPKEDLGHKLMTVSLTGHARSMEFLPVDECEEEPLELYPFQEDIEFALIPSGCNIVSASGICRVTSDYVVGLTLCNTLPNESGIPEPATQSLHIYSNYKAKRSLSKTAESCAVIELDFIPYHLYNCKVSVHNPKFRNTYEYVFLLSGSDKKIHLFLEDRLYNTYVGIETERFFPELAHTFPSIPLKIDCLHVMEYYTQRLSAVSCECGTVFLFLVDCSSRSPTILKSWKGVFGEGPLTSIKLYKTKPTRLEPPDSVHVLTQKHWRAQYEVNKGKGPDWMQDEIPIATKEANLLVTYSFSEAVVFYNVTENGLTSFSLLPRSHCFDVPVACLSTDIDFDGHKELVLGTFGQKLLVYKEVEDKKWKLQSKRSFGHPIMGLEEVDMTGDGVKELVVSTTQGLHILQHSQPAVQIVRERKLNNLLEKLDIKNCV